MTRHLITLIISTLAFISPLTATADNSIGDILDGILVSMDHTPDFDSMLSAMESTSSKSNNIHPASIADAMTINSTLDYLSDIYSSPLPSYSKSSTSYRSAYDYSQYLSNGAQLPISGRLTSGFGYRPKFGRMHKGVDIALQMGDTVCAAIAGTVERVANDPKGYGLFVCIRHDNGMETRYAHLSRQLVTPGMRIMAGEPVGLGGSTGNSTGPHLHFETRINGEVIDPTTMFDFSMPGGASPYRTLTDLDKKNPRLNPATDNLTQATAALMPAGSGKSTYIVRPGDTIEAIARKNGISVLSLCRLNMLSTTDQLQPGRMLKLR